MRLLLYSFVFLISYGSLYPFSFESTSINEALQSPLFNFRLGNSGRGDMIANILLFVPFGFLALHSYPSNKALLRTIQILFVAFILAYLLQVLQLFVPRRTPSGSDAIWNLLGCLMGCALARLPLQKYQR